MSSPSPTASNGSHDFPDRGPLVFAVTTATLCLATVFVLSRMVCRYFIVKKVSRDDWLMLVAWIIAVGLSITIDVAAKNGLGRHDENIEEWHWPSLRRCEYAFTVLYNPALMATKTSILVFYLRLSKNTQRVLRTVSWITLFVVVIAGIVLTFLNVFQCQPIGAAWSASDTSADARCIPILTEFICSAPINIVTDLAILALPIPVLTSMRLPSKQKTILVFTFTVGIFVTIVDVVRIYYLQQAVTATPTIGLSNDPNATFGGPAQFAWNASLSFMWSAVEVNVGMTCACIPTLKPLILKLLPVLLMDPNATRTSTSSSEKEQQQQQQQQQQARPDPSPVARIRAATFAGTLSGRGLEGWDGSEGPEGPDQEREQVQWQGNSRRNSHEVSRENSRDDDDDDADDDGDVPMSAFQFLASGSPMTATPDSESHSQRFAEDRYLTAPVMSPGHQRRLRHHHHHHHHHHDYHHPRSSKRPGARPENGSNSSGGSSNRESMRENVLYFGFVNMQQPKSMLKTSAAESFRYCTTVTILFLLWGMSYGLLNILNNVVASINHMTRAETLGLTAIYFGGGYFFGPLLVGEWILRRDEHYRIRRRKGAGVDSVGGFKATFIVGLCIYGIGTIIFWPSAVTNSYGGFMLSNFVVGFGVSVLETGGNAFLVLCGPPEYGETRALLAQGVQSVGAVVSEVMARKAFFRDIARDSESESMRLINVQWTYLAITLVCVGLALFFYYMPLPETCDAELEEAAYHRNVDPKKQVGFSVGPVRLQLRTWSLLLAVFAQYNYVAAQETCGIYFQSLMLSLVPGQASSGDSALRVASDAEILDRPPALALGITDYLILAHTGFALSRFLTGYLTYLSASRPHMPQPRTILTVSSAMSTCCALAICLFPRSADPNLLAIPLILFYFSQGPIWPLIYAIGLRGQGRRTKRAAAFITMAGSGPAFAPFIMYGIVTQGGTVQIAFLVILTMQFLTLAYPVFLDALRDARLLVDPRITALWRHDPTVRTGGDGEEEEEGDGGERGEDGSRSSSSSGGEISGEGAADASSNGTVARPLPTADARRTRLPPDERTAAPEKARWRTEKRARLSRVATTMGTRLGVVRAKTVA